MINKRILIISLSVLTIFFSLVGCNSKNEEVISYSSAEKFEEALNKGIDATGAMVTFSAGITSPGPDGYYMYAGKKLAFVSSDHPNINPGSLVSVKIKSFKNIEGTWNIEYER